MGKISILTKEQKLILDLISKNKYFSSNFYFTGGTALSNFYLRHRFSDDLDFFSTDKIEQDVIFGIISNWSIRHGFKFQSRFVEVVYRFDLDFPSKMNIKVDFGSYPYQLLEKGQRINDMDIDSIRDIATNKLTTVNQRTNIKDFVDLYFLLKDHFTIWDLLYGSEVKFKNMVMDTILLAEDFLKVDDFDTLPKMIKPLTLKQLKTFYRNLAKELGRKAVV